MKTNQRTPIKFKKGFFLIILAASVLFFTFVFTFQPFSAEAKGRFGPSKSPDEIVQLLTDRLELTEEQVEAIRPIIEEKVQQRDEIRKKAGTDRRAVRSEIQKLKWSTDIQLNEILTDEQIERYLELRQEQHEKMSKGWPRGGKRFGGINRTPEQVIARLTDRLDLTDEQTAEVEPIIEESIEKRRVIFDKYSEQGREARNSMRDEMRTIGDETEAQLATILTDEQLEVFRTIREERRARMDRRMNRPGPMEF